MQRTWWPEAGTIIVTGPYCRARNRFMAIKRCFGVLLMSKPRWPPISSYENMKTSDEKYKTQLRLLVYLHTQLWYYVPTHHQAPLQTHVQDHHHT